MRYSNEHRTPSMAEDPESSSFLSRAYKTAKLVAVASASVAGLIVSLAALDITKGRWWVDNTVPLYGVTLIVVLVIILCTGVIIVLVAMTRNALSALSFYRNKAKNFEAVVSTLQDLAYNDSITGIPNSNKLKEDIDAKRNDRAQCLILLDLQDFGKINKKYNHWVGDEYLRKFAQMVTNSGRRNEFLFKSRPLRDSQEEYEGDVRAKDEVKAFRKNSGGDEFFILLEGTIIDCAFHGKHRRERLARHSFPATAFSRGEKENEDKAERLDSLLLQLTACAGNASFGRVGFRCPVSCRDRDRRHRAG